MKTQTIVRFSTWVFMATCVFTGCESNDSSSPASSTTVYYGAAFYDPWYHGDWDDDYDVVVHPPNGSGNRPPGTGDIGARPEHPIAEPPGISRPPSASQLPSSRPPSVATRPSGGISSRPMPSIPSAPRAAPRGGGGRGRR